MILDQSQKAKRAKEKKEVSGGWVKGFIYF